MYLLEVYDIIVGSLRGFYMNNSEIYYKRGLHIINKLLNIFSNDDSFYKKRLMFMEEEFKRYANFYDIALKDTNAFSMTGLVTLLGLNKENVEDTEKNANYNFSRFTIKDKREIEKVKQSMPLFEKDRVINTKYDEWLNVTNIDYPTIDYMYNVRNGLLHSEYDFYDDCGNIMYVKNSNYTKFEGKILFDPFKKFGLFYFGNASWTGLSENSYVFGINSDNRATNMNELENIIDTIGVIGVEYKLSEDNIDIVAPEEKLHKLLIKNKRVNDIYAFIDKIYRNYAKEYTVSDFNLSLEQKSIIKKMIVTYYGNEFFTWEYDRQFYAILFCCKFLFDSRNIISEWVSDFVKLFEYIKNNNYLNYKDVTSEKYFNSVLTTNISDVVSVEDGKRSVFACRTSLLMMKSYHILYRLQNINFVEVDYSNINFDFSSGDYTFTRIDVDKSVKVNDFSDDVNKLVSKYVGLSNDVIKNIVLCEIIRNALSHGNVNMTFKIDDNDRLVEYIVLEDRYHSKSRKIEMTFDMFEKFLCSEAFLSKYCVLDKGRAKVK